MEARNWLSGLSGPRRRYLAVVAILVLVVAAFVGVRLAASGGDPAAGPPGQQRPGAVLLVPGYGGSTGSLDGLAAKLRAAGRTAEVVDLPGDGTGDLLIQVDTLNTAVARALSEGAPSVDVVGYSAGGVVARLWVARDNGAAHARRIVTLGSPLHGTQLAAAGAALAPGACPLACQQLAPTSALLRGLDAQPLPAGLPWLSLWTTGDQTVLPPDSARLTGAVNVPVQQICLAESVSHSALPSDPLVDGIVLQALDSASFTPPRPAQCAALTAAGRINS
ncbi:MAG TPA: lipase [Pseudonocardiaceae bacterium]|nr:lipase [Pseudonocardiaceae bacterium]